MNTSYWVASTPATQITTWRVSKLTEDVAACQAMLRLSGEKMTARPPLATRQRWPPKRSIKVWPLSG